MLSQVFNLCLKKFLIKIDMHIILAIFMIFFIIVISLAILRATSGAISLSIIFGLVYYFAFNKFHNYEYLLYLFLAIVFITLFANIADEGNN